MKKWASARWARLRYLISRKVEWPPVILAVILVVVAICFIVYAVIAPAPPGFWWDALANGISDFIVGILILGFITWFLARSKKAAASIVAIASPSSTDHVSLDFTIRNLGRISFRTDEIYWHLFVSANLEIRRAVETLEGLNVNPRYSLVMQGETFNYYSGRCNDPVFHGRDTRILHFLVVRVSNGSTILNSAGIKFPTPAE